MSTTPADSDSLGGTSGDSDSHSLHEQPEQLKSLTSDEFKRFELTLGGMMGWVEDVLNGKMTGTHVVGAPVYIDGCRFRIEIYVPEISKEVALRLSQRLDMTLSQSEPSKNAPEAHKETINE